MHLVLHNLKGLHMQHKFKKYTAIYYPVDIFTAIFFLLLCYIGPPLNTVAEVTICRDLKGEKPCVHIQCNNGPSKKQTTSLQQTYHLPPRDFTIELIHFKPPTSGHLSAPYSIHWWAQMYPSHKLPPKTGSETSPTIIWTLVNRFCKIVRHCHRMALLALLFIMLALLAIVQQQRGPKIRPDRVQQAWAEITMPTGVPNAIRIPAYQSTECYNGDT